jgi:uncharacterized membrane protein
MTAGRGIFAWQRLYIKREFRLLCWRKRKNTATSLSLTVSAKRLSMALLTSRMHDAVLFRGIVVNDHCLRLKFSAVQRPKVAVGLQLFNGLWELDSMWSTGT